MKHKNVNKSAKCVASFCVFVNVVDMGSEKGLFYIFFFYILLTHMHAQGFKYVLGIEVLIFIVSENTYRIQSPCPIVKPHRNHFPRIEPSYFISST